MSPPPTFRALAEAFVPETAGLSEPDWAEVAAIVEGMLAGQPGRRRVQLRLLISLVNVLAMLRYGRPATRLDSERRTRLLETLSRAPILLLRRGVWGLRTLVMMGYYARSAGAAATGYRVSPQGWAARR